MYLMKENNRQLCLRVESSNGLSCKKKKKKKKKKGGGGKGHLLWCEPSNSLGPKSLEAVSRYWKEKKILYCIRFLTFREGADKKQITSKCLPSLIIKKLCYITKDSSTCFLITLEPMTNMNIIDTSTFSIIKITRSL